MSESDNESGRPEVLFKGKKLRIVRLGDRRLLVRSAGRWSYSLLLCLCCPLAALGLCVSVVWVYVSLVHAARNPEDNFLGLVCGVPFTFFWIFVLLGTIHSLLWMALPRITIVDLDAGTVEIRQIPGFTKQLALAQVSTVDLVMFSGHGICHLGFTHKLTGTLHQLHWLAGQFDSAVENRNQLLPAARLIAQFVDKPLESSWGKMGWSLRKGTDAPIASP